jgi:hypothetical protein
MVTTNAYRFEIHLNKPYAMAVRCLDWIHQIYPSTKVDPRKPFCAVEIIVGETICMFRNATKETSS